MQADMALAHDLERRDQLLAEERGAEVVEGERGEGGNDLEIALPCAVVALDAPQRHHHRGRQPHGRSEAVDQRAVRAEQRLAVLHSLRRHDQALVLGPAHLEFGLVARELHHLGQELHPGQGLLGRAWIDARPDRLGLERGEPGDESGFGT